MITFDEYLNEKMKDADFVEAHKSDIDEFVYTSNKLSELLKSQFDKTDFSVDHAQRIIQLNKKIAIIKGRLMGNIENHTRI